MLQRIIALILLLLISPLLCIFYLIMKISTPGSFLFTQLRTGKGRKPFKIYKIRTMVENADELKKTIRHMNEADGPVFKIRHDPRYTLFGKMLSHTGLDEMPQLINIIRGEMSFVGPRPLPVEEAAQIPKKYEERFTVLPGITSSWVTNGAHSLSFDEWMELDVEYVKKKNLWFIFGVVVGTIILIVRNFFPRK